LNEEGLLEYERWIERSTTLDNQLLSRKFGGGEEDKYEEKGKERNTKTVGKVWLVF